MIRVIAAIFGALATAGVAGVVMPPTLRLAPRLRPYTLLARARLGRNADVIAAPESALERAPLGRIVGPPVRSAFARLSRLIERRSDHALQLSLTRGGFFEVTPDDYRSRVVGAVLLYASAGAAFGFVVFGAPIPALGLMVCGAVFGGSRTRGRVDRAILERRERIRLELYTVNQLLAMHVRTGAGPIQATQRIVERGRGVLVDELDAVLRSIRSGVSEPAAFRRAAELTPEPGAARTYRLFAAGAERGVDLAGGLRALSEDLRDSRREEVRKTATKRRAAMLLPTIAVLAPVMLLFIAAPLPSVVFGGR